MSTQTSVLLTSVPKQLTIYLGIPILMFGVIGGLLNIFVFLSLKTFRQSSSAFFLTLMSCVNIGQLLTSLLSRILTSGFDNNWTETSIVFCKFRSYCLQLCALISYSCMCLATIDQYLATSLHLRWQQWITLSRAYTASGLMVILWMLHGIPTLIWYSPVRSIRASTITCSCTNRQFQQYFTYGYTIVLTGIVPIAITTIFGTLAYRNVRQIPYRTVPLVRRELDKQLTSMVLVQLVHNIFVIVPYVGSLLINYSSNLSISAPNYAAIVFSTVLTGLIHYLYFAVRNGWIERRCFYADYFPFRVLCIFMFAFHDAFVNNSATFLLVSLRKVDNHKR
jgi:hypothetical protein